MNDPSLIADIAITVIGCFTVMLLLTLPRLGDALTRLLARPPRGAKPKE